jgi:hypothetical protein
MNNLRSDQPNAWLDPNPGVAPGERLDGLQELVDAGRMKMDRCHCPSLPYSDWDRSLNEFLLSQSDERLPIPTDEMLSDIVSRLLTGFVDLAINPLSFPITSQLLEPCKMMHTLSYRREPDSLNPAGVLNDLQLMVRHSKALTPAELRRVKAMLIEVAGNRSNGCCCFPGQKAVATAGELQGWVHTDHFRWASEALAEAEAGLKEIQCRSLDYLCTTWLDQQDFRHTIKEFAYGVAHPGEPITHRHDCPAAGAIAYSVAYTDDYPNTARAIERWRHLTPSQLNQPPHDLYRDMVRRGSTVRIRQTASAVFPAQAMFWFSR